MSKLLHLATECGDLDCIVALSKVSHVDPNWKGAFGWTALHEACFKTNTEIMKFLLGWDKTDPNARESQGRTALFMACESRQLDIVSLLLSDPRVDVNRTNNDGKTPLWEACERGYLSVVKRLLASGRTINTETTPYFNDTTAAGIARSEEHSVIANLVESFERNPDKVTNELRKELGLHVKYIGELFALVIYFSDGYLRPIKLSESSCSLRFFSIASRLPLELQMLLCHRVYGSTGTIVATKHSEPAFIEYAKKEQE